MPCQKQQSGSGSDCPGASGIYGISGIFTALSRLLKAAFSKNNSFVNLCQTCYILFCGHIFFRTAALQMFCNNLQPCALPVRVDRGYHLFLKFNLGIGGYHGEYKRGKVLKARPFGLCY
jgi:hypothetical protein